MNINDADSGMIVLIVVTAVVILTVFLVTNYNETKIQELAIKNRCEIVRMKIDKPIYGNCKGEISCTGEIK